MKLTIGALMATLAAGAATAGSAFPYADALTQRYSLTEETKLTSFQTVVPVPEVAGGMQASEHVAVLTFDIAEFTAVDAEDWADSTNVIGTAMQASLSMKYDENGTLVWMGYTSDGWKALTGKTPAEGAWSVKIEIDYSVSPKRVRYSVKSTGESEYTALAENAVAWLPLGGDASVVQGVGLRGYGTVTSVDGNCAARPFDGTVSTAETYSMQYSDLKVVVAATNAWGDTVRVTLKKDGVAVAGAVQSGAPEFAADGTCSFVADFSGLTTVGDDYTYDVEFLKGGATLRTETAKNPVRLYSQIDWFGFRDGAFTNATTEGIYIDAANGTFSSDEDDVAGTVTPAEVSDDGAQTTVETEVIVAGASAIGELPTDEGQQFAVALATVTSGDETVRKWCSRVGSGAWTASDAAIATTNGAYLVKVTFDYRVGQKTGTCWVKPADDSEAYVALVSGFALGEATKLAGTAVLGGDIGYMNASRKTVQAAPVVPDEAKKEIRIGSNAKVDLKDLSGEYTVTNTGSAVSHLSWQDGTSGKYAKVNETTGKLEIKTGTPANGLDSFESYVLNLDADSATSKPIVRSEQISDTSKIKFTLPGLSPKDKVETGVAVSYELLELSSPNAATVEKTTAFSSDGSATVDLPASGAKFYKVKINFAK